ncbi:MAG: hypothetical protein WBP45_07740 [Daejeonella sp.]
MKKILLTLLSLVCFTFSYVYAQSNDGSARLFQFEKGQVTYVFADTAKVRLQAGITGKVADTLKAGDEIMITDTSGVYTRLAGKNAQWYKVSYLKNGKEKEAFIWGALLSFSPHNKGNIKFLYGIEKTVFVNTEKEHKEDVFASVKVIQNDTLVYKAPFTFAGFDFSVYPKAQVLDSKGLKNIDCIFQCTFSLMVPLYDFYFLWNGKSLYALPVLTTSGEEVDEGYIGIDASYIFPTDAGGKPGNIILQKKDSDFDKNNKIKVTKTYKYYTWNGQTLKLAPAKRK